MCLCVLSEKDQVAEFLEEELPFSGLMRSKSSSFPCLFFLFNYSFSIIYCKLLAYQPSYSHMISAAAQVAAVDEISYRDLT